MQMEYELRTINRFGKNHIFFSYRIVKYSITYFIKNYNLIYLDSNIKQFTNFQNKFYGYKLCFIQREYSIFVDRIKFLIIIS